MCYKRPILIITKKRTQPDIELKIFNKNIPNVKSVKYLGPTLDRSLTWAEHIKRIANIATGNLISLYPMLKAPLFPRKKKLQLFKEIIRPLLLYGCEIWGYATPINFHEQYQMQAGILVMKQFIDY
ncbi:hypothetical protein PR048_021159 [Dryococelus australis]|uniref:Uncharacterized protein n=1 Tax=Dryococelus australis TaxID=614101 RepID=A0ABQ9GXG8_9NEOP|nr:hypothetical protein PR048_021159 [Dryococelus australis]